jgi:hypothetical protein
MFPGLRMTDDEPGPEPPKPCPICRVTMQVAETEDRRVHECHNCGMTIVTVLQPKDK